MTTDWVEGLAGNPIFGRFNRECLQAVAGLAEPVVLAEGEPLFRYGEDADSLYLILSGEIETSVRWLDQSVRLARLHQHDLVAGAPVLAPGTRLFDAVASLPARLIRLPRSAFEALRADFGNAVEQLSDALTRTLRESVRLRLALRLSRLFQDLDEEQLRALEEEMELLYLPCEELLCRQGEPSDNLYLVVNGLLQVARANADGESVLGTIAPGDTVGEIGVMTGNARGASVRAVRDTLCAALSQRGYERLMQRFPLALGRAFSRSIVRNLSNRSSSRRRGAHTLAVVPLGESLDTAAVARHLLRAFGGESDCRLLDGRTYQRAFGAREPAAPGSPGEADLLQWLGEQEMRHRHLLYLADPTLTDWTRRVLRQADRLLFVAATDADHRVGPVEQAMLREPGVAMKDKSLLLLASARVRPTETVRWLEPRSVDRHFHVDPTSIEGYQRVVRFLTNRAVGVVLGGGGARGFAHVGILRAMDELGIPVDLVGGNSMGAIIGAQTALQWDLADMVARTRELALAGDEFTLPLLSLLSGRRMVRGIRQMFGSDSIEDLWVPYYSVSCNLSRATTVVHATGSLSEAVIASNSAPGLLPPRVIDGDLHVDGALLNNTPVDVMREFNPDGHVIAIDVSPKEEMLNNTRYDEGLSGWRLLRNRLNPFEQRIRIPSIRNILIRASMIGGVAQQARSMDGLADLYLMPPVGDHSNIAYRQAERIVEAGYRYGLERLSQWQERLQSQEGRD